MAKLIAMTRLRHAAGKTLFLNSRHLSRLPASINILQAQCRQTLLCPKQTGFNVSLSRTLSTKLVSEDGIIRSPDPDIEVRRDITLHDYMYQHFKGHEEDPLMEDFLSGKMYTYGQFKTNAHKVANSLHKLGYHKNDSIFCFCPNYIDLSVALFACFSLGVIFTAYNPTAQPDELSRALKLTKPKAIITIPELKNVVKSAIELIDKPSVKDIITLGEAKEQHELPFHSLLAEDSTPPQIDIDPPNQVVFQLFSSGTTGLPKCVQHSHATTVINLMQLMAGLDIKPYDRTCCFLPFFHLTGLQFGQLVMPLYTGFSSFLPRFDPELFLTCMQKTKVTFQLLVPPVIQFLATYPGVEKFDLTSLKRTLYGAAPMSITLMDKFLKRFPHIESAQQGYGMTESFGTACNRRADLNTSIGQLLPNIVAKVVDVETGVTLGPGQEGELCCKGPQIMMGYLDNPKATNAMIKPDGWLHSGDIGYYTEDGSMYVTDRIKDLIKYKASQIAPAELEDVLLQHPDVTDAAVVGIPDYEAGEVPKAFVVKLPNSNVTEDELQKFVKERTSKTKWLRGGVVFLEAIPKLPSGKILKRVLRERKE